MRRILVLAAACCLLTASSAHAQGLRDLISQLFIFGPGQDPLFLGGTADPSNPVTIQIHGNHFTPAAAAGNGTVIAFITSAVSSSVSDFPISATSSGSTFRFEGGQPVQTSLSPGPIFAERAPTLGRGHALVGLSYNSFHYATLRGVDMNNIQLTFTHANVDNATCDSVAGTDCAPMGVPNLENDIMPFVLSLDIDVKLVSFVATYGVTDRFDVGVALPVASTSLLGHSDARIIPFGGPTAAHFFSGTPQNPGLEAQRFVQGSATGIGDVAARAKLLLHRSDQLNMAILTDMRFPTGSPEDLLGSGHFSGRVLGVMSSRYGPFSPHANVGYLYRAGEERTDAVLATAGFDHQMANWATLVVDLLTQFQVGDSKLTVPGDVHFDVPFSRNVRTSDIPNRRDDIIDGSIGFKFTFAQSANMIVNTLWPLNSGGMRTNVLWTLGMEYNF